MKDNNITPQLIKLLRDLVGMFMAYPADLDITPGGIGRIVCLNWRGNQADKSRMIGEKGQTYQELAALFATIGDRHGYDVELARVGDSVRGVEERYSSFKANPQWPRERILKLLDDTVTLAAGINTIAVADIGTTTAIEVSIARTESLNKEMVLRKSLKHIFNVIGNANGRTIKVDVRRSLEPDEQPATADGRFTKAANK